MTRSRGVLAGVVAGAAVCIAGGLIAVSGARQATAAAQDLPANTATVDRGTLSDMVSQYGTLTYQAQVDGSPYAVINHARGTYTGLPGGGARVACGGVLYRVNDNPVVLLCGSTPAYRSLSQGASGADVAELNANLVHLGYATRAQIDPSSRRFGSATRSALERLQSRLGEARTGALKLSQTVFLPQAVRIAGVTGELGGSAQPGARVMSATADTLEVQVNLAPAQQGEVRKGDRARITLPSNKVVTGKVIRLGRVAQIPAGQDAKAGATSPAYISLDHPQQARRLDQAPVQVAITTRGVENALSVPVTAIVGTSGGGFAVELVRADRQRELVPVTLGLFDTAGGRVQVAGDLREGERVLVGSS